MEPLLPAIIHIKTSQKEPVTHQPLSKIPTITHNLMVIPTYQTHHLNVANILKKPLLLNLLKHMEVSNQTKQVCACTGRGALPV